MNGMSYTPDPKIALTLEELTACQHLAATHITFSLTLSCPLNCAHCIVRAGPDKAATTMPQEIAARYGAQMRELAAYGIKGICFTGGEPFAAYSQLETISREAAAAGITASVVTSAKWAKTPRRAQSLVDRFSGISRWDISFDSHHLPWVQIGHIRNALEAVRGVGRKATIRVTYSDPLTTGDREVIGALEEIGETEWIGQAMRPVGRGERLAPNNIHGWSPWIKPCLTQGMVVRYDGTVAPCCLNLVESRQHPFDFGDPHSDSLVTLHRRFLSDPLLQLIRVFGFSHIREWIDAEGLAQRLPDPLPEEVCELCVGIMHDPVLTEVLVRRTTTDDVPLKIAILAAKLLGEDEMLRTFEQTTLHNRKEDHL